MSPAQPPQPGPSPATLALRDQRYARTIDREVAPVWHDRFARLIWRNLPSVSGALTLDVHSGPGRTTAELLDRLDEGCRIVALEPSEAMRGLAKARIAPEAKQRVYLKPGDLADVVDMPDDTYDLVVANLVLGEVGDLAEALRGLLRVCKPGGTVMVTLPMAETWSEAEDLFAEVLRDAGLPEALDRLQRIVDLRPSGEELARLLSELQVGVDHYVIEQERFELLFRSGREFLFSPVIELGPLRLWKAIIGQGGNPQQLFFRFKETIDAYFKQHPLAVTVAAGVLRIRVPQPGVGAAHDAAEIAGEYWGRYPELDSLWRARERGDLTLGRGFTATAQASSERGAADEELDIDIELDDDEAAAVPRAIDPEDDVTSRRLLVSRKLTGSHRRVDAVEEEAIRALLDQPANRAEPDSELDSLLDQVLEFEGSSEQIEELDDAELEEVPPPDLKRPGETLKRIKALLPPPPSRPPPPPRGGGRKR